MYIKWWFKKIILLIYFQVKILKLKMKAKKWILAKRFEGLPTEENLRLVDEELPDDLKRDQILLQAVYLSVDPYMRCLHLYF